MDDALESIKALCEPVEPPKDTIAYIHYFCSRNTENPDELIENEQKRIALYKHTVALIRAYANLANEMEEAGYSPKEIEEIKEDVKYYESVREEMKRASGDLIDLKAYEPAMRHLIDTYIRAEESEKISAFDDLTLIELIVERGAEAIQELPNGISQNKEAVAETIENNVRRLIIDETPTNPKYYENMSTLLDELIKARKEAAKNYEEYLAEIVELRNNRIISDDFLDKIQAVLLFLLRNVSEVIIRLFLSKKVKKPGSTFSYPRSLNSNAKRAFIRNKTYIDLHVRTGSTREQREKVMMKWYRKQLKEQIPEIIENWQSVMGVEVDSWGVKLMKTKWGTCNISAKRIWLNLELAKKPKHCLEFIIVHEMIHLLERHHNDRFIAYMDKFMPQWRGYKDELNSFILDHTDWSY